MTIQKFDKIYYAQLKLSELTVTGCRNVKRDVHGKMKALIKSKSAERHKNSKYVVTTTNINVGTKGYPDIIEEVDVYSLRYIRETEKSLIYDDGGYKRVIAKSHVIGYLTDEKGR